MDELSWADFILWLESRYPSLPAAADQQITGRVVLRVPGALVVRVSMDGGPKMLSVPASSWQRFAVGQDVILSRTGVKGRTAGSRSVMLEDEGGSFTPPAYAGRETPQRPEPGYGPRMNEFTRYDAQATASTGFADGVLLDSGMPPGAPLRWAGYVNHQTRKVRTLYSPLVPLRRRDDFTGRGLTTVGWPAVLNLPVVVIDQGRDTASTTEAYPQNFVAPTAAAFQAKIDDVCLLVPGVGRLFIGNSGFTGRLDVQTTVTVTNDDETKEEDGVSFDGTPITWPLLPGSSSLSAQATEVIYVANLPSATTGTSANPGNPNPPYFLRPTLGFVAPGPGSLRVVRYNRPVPIGSTGAIFDSLSYMIRPMTVTFTGSGPNGVTYSGSFNTVGMIMAGGDLNYLQVYGAGVPGQAVDRLGNGLSYNVFRADAGVVMPQVFPAAADPRPLPPPEKFVSPVVRGRSFTVNERVPAYLQEFPPQLYDLTQSDLFIDGVMVSGQFSTWTAFQDETGLTLLAMTASAVTVIPGLDLGKKVTVSHTVFLRDMRLPAGASLILGM